MGFYTNLQLITYNYGAPAAAAGAGAGGGGGGYDDGGDDDVGGDDNDDVHEEGMVTCSMEVGYVVSCENPKGNPSSGTVLLPIRNAMLISSTPFHLCAFKIHWYLRFSLTGQTTGSVRNYTIL